MEVEGLTLITVFSNVRMTGSARSDMLSPMTEMEKTLLAKDTLVSSPRKTAVCEIKELLKVTSLSNLSKRVFGRTHASLEGFPKLMECPSLGTDEGSMRLISRSKVSVLSLSVPPVGRLIVAAISSSEDTILYVENVKTTAAASAYCHLR